MSIFFMVLLLCMSCPVKREMKHRLGLTTAAHVDAGKVQILVFVPIIGKAMLRGTTSKGLWACRLYSRLVHGPFWQLMCQAISLRYFREGSCQL